MQPQSPDRESPLSASPGAESQVGTQTRTATFRPDFSDTSRVETPRPASVGRYEIRELLGQGAFGAVYLGWDPQLKRQVAIKVPRLAAENATTESNAAQIEAFLEEARRAVQLERHQGIVPVYDVGRDGDFCYIVSQYLEGGTLSQLMKQGLVPVEKAVSLMATLADIAHFAHKQGWVHRDIKPSNILLDSERNPYLADFGLTSRLDDMRSADGPPNGTPNYMAPELAREALVQLRREKSPVAIRPDRTPAALRPDQRSDVYSLGVVLYQLLTGRLPYVADNLEDLFDRVLHSDPVPPRLAGAKVSARLEEVCLKALAKDPGDRYRTAADLRDDLKVVAATLRDTEGQVKVYDRSPWGSSRTRMAAIVGTWLLLCVLLGAVYYAASFAFRKPVEHTSPGGETNVAMATSKADKKQPETPPSPPAPAARDRRELLNELRALLRDEGELENAPKELTANGVMAKAGADKLADPLPRGVPSSTPEAAKAELALQERFKTLEKQMDSARKERDDEREFSLLMKATNEFVDGGLPREAERAARRMTELAERDDAKRAIAYGQLGIAQSRLGKHEESLASHERALADYREIFTALKESKHPEAQKNLSHMSRMLGLTLNRVGNANKQLKRYDAAEKAYAEASDTLLPFADRKSELVTVLMNYGALESTQHKHAEARELLTQALTLAVELKDKTAEAETLVNLGNAESRGGNDGQAIVHYARADELLSPDAPYDVRSRLFYNWISSLLAEQRYDEARVQAGRLKEIARPDDPLVQRILKSLE